LNSVLFSFPGTPILYYGDEIGMGDNIYLGDRNGVRTPMQWSADRNAGLLARHPRATVQPGHHGSRVRLRGDQRGSRAGRSLVAAELDAQHDRAAQLFRVFGRGTMEFLHPANRKVLAYVRSYENERILCVANLSRFAQPVELDLFALRGLDAHRDARLRRISQIRKTPYPLTLDLRKSLVRLQPAFVPSVLGEPPVVTRTKASRLPTGKSS